jgi:hypothetical protein
MFTNQPIQIEHIPRVDFTDFLPLHIKLKTRGLINRLIFSIILMIGPTVVYFFAPFDIFLMILIPFVIAIVIIMIWPLLSYSKKSYLVREHDILYQSGVIWKSFKALPFNRLQHIELSRSPVDRTLGLATLIFYTAGGSYGDLRINGFTDDVANKIREQILSIMKKETNDQSE